MRNAGGDDEPVAGTDGNGGAADDHSPEVIARRLEAMPCAPIPVVTKPATPSEADGTG
jgi:hypothetical protein